MSRLETKFHKEKLFQTFELAVVLTLFGSIAKSNQFVCYDIRHINSTNIQPIPSWDHTMKQKDMKQMKMSGSYMDG